MTNPETQHGPSDKSLLELTDEAFVFAGSNPEAFKLETTTDNFGMPLEKLTYYTEGENHVVIYRHSLDARALRDIDDDPHSKTPLARVELNAKRPFVLYLASGERYHAGAGYCGLGLFDDGAYVDRSATAYRSVTEEGGSVRTELTTIGFFYAPMETGSDWFIQEFIDPSKVIIPPNA